MKNLLVAALLFVFVPSWLLAGTSDVADAAMSKNAAAVRALIQQKANVNAAQADGTTALHWAALLGEDRLTERLIVNSDLNLRDEKYNSSPLGWAIHGCYNSPAGNRGKQHEVAAC